MISPGSEWAVTVNYRDAGVTMTATVRDAHDLPR